MREADRRKQLAKRMKYAVCIGTGIVIGIIAGICIGIDYNKTTRSTPALYTEMEHGRFQVVFGLGASAAVGRVALDDRALHRIADQGRLQEIVASRLSGREFHGDLLPFGLPAQGLVDGFHSRGRDVAGHVDFGGSRLRRLFVVARRTAGACGREMQNKGDHTDFFIMAICVLRTL